MRTCSRVRSSTYSLAPDDANRQVNITFLSSLASGRERLERVCCGLPLSAGDARRFFHRTQNLLYLSSNEKARKLDHDAVVLLLCMS